MMTISQSTEDAIAGRKWWVVDASGQTLGRLSSQIATVLRGKHKPTYTPHVDGGDFVIVINASKIKLSGNKLKDKLYQRHTGFIGNLKTISAGDMLEKSPDQLIHIAVLGMLPKGTLGRNMIDKLKIYGGAEHPHIAQQPAEFKPQYSAN